MFLVNTAKQLYNLAGYISFLFIGSNIFLEVVRLPTMLEGLDAQTSLVLKIIAGIVAIFKGYDYFYEAKHNRKIRIEELKSIKFDNLVKEHKEEIYTNKEDALDRFAKKIKNNTITDLELIEIGFTEDEIKKLKK